MRFLRRQKKSKKTILVISDLHLGAGFDIEGRKNFLEDFHADEELVAFFDYYSSAEYLNKEVELIINGDFLDLLAVPHVSYFDDEYWSEKSALEKLNKILLAHPEVIQAIDKFLSTKNKKLVYIIGNHDAEFVFDSLKEKFVSSFSPENQEKIVLSNDIEVYSPAKGIYIKHGHQYEQAHLFDLNGSIIESSKDEKYFIPPWGSYYVTHVINRYKQERYHINFVRPIHNFLIHGLLFDTFFTMRFMFANFYYFFMVRFLHYYRLGLGWKRIIEDTVQELTLFQDFESITRSFFQSKDDAKVLIVGHTHEPIYREFLDGTSFINTGTWTEMVSLDLKDNNAKTQLTYAKVDLYDLEYDLENFNDSVSASLNCWEPLNSLPYFEYR